MNKKKILVAGAALLVLASCSKNRPAHEAESEAAAENGQFMAAISLGFSTNLDDPRGVASLLFKEEVEKNSGGRIKIAVHPDGELGSDSELIEGVINGRVDMTVSSAGNFAVYATKLGVSAMPFLFSDFEEAWEFMDSEVIRNVNATLEEFNIVVLSHYDNGFRCVTTTSRAVNSVADMRGLNIRTPPNQIVMETMSALGANPKPYPFNELKQALQDGLFDSQENPIPIIYNNRLFEEQNYLAVTNHSYDAMPLVIRKDLWDIIPEPDRQLLLAAAVKAQDLNRSIVREQTNSYVERLREAGMTITRPDLAEFARASAPVLDVFSSVYGSELLELISK